MGQFLQTLKQVDHGPLKNPLLGSSLSKLREYYGAFKGVCDNYSIDLTEYEQIFGSNETSFQIFDTDKNGLIDALEFFSGLIIFGDGKFSEKQKFLFDIFDFNELNKLQIIDIEFMIISLCNATLKIYGQNREIEDDVIVQFIHNYFSETTFITSETMLKWCQTVKDIQKFMEFIQREPPQKQVQRKGQIITMEINEPEEIDQDQHLDQFLDHGENVQTLRKNEEEKLQKRPAFKTELARKSQLEEAIQSKQYQSQIEWISNISRQLFQTNSSKDQGKDFRQKMNWIYGVSTENIKKPIYLQSNSNDFKGQNKKIFYFCNCIVVIYFPKLKEQKHYLEHNYEVISLALGQKSSICASGDRNPYPTIHVWNSDTQLNIGIIKGTHREGVALLEFFQSDEYLASCGTRCNTPILVYNVKNFELILSTSIEGFCVDLLTCQVAAIGKPEKKKKRKQERTEDLSSFIVLGCESVNCFSYKQDHFLRNVINLRDLNVLELKITCGAYFYVGDGSELVLGLEKGKVIVFRDFQLEKIHELSSSQNILAVRACRARLVIVDVSGCFELYDYNCNDKSYYCSFHIIQNQLNIKLNSYSILNVAANIFESYFMLITKGGDLLICKQNKKTQEQIIKRKNILQKFQGQLTCCSLREDAETQERYLYIGSIEGYVYIFNCETHHTIDIWQVEKDLSCLECGKDKQNRDLCVYSCGNVIYIKCEGVNSYSGEGEGQFDPENEVDKLTVESRIMDFKLTKDCSKLVFGCEDGSVQIFASRINSNQYHFVQKFVLQDEIPASIDFVDDENSFLLGTNCRNQFRIELTDLKQKNILKEKEQIYCTIWNLEYPLNFQQEQHQSLLKKASSKLAPKVQDQMARQPADKTASNADKQGQFGEKHGEKSGHYGERRFQTAIQLGHSQPEEIYLPMIIGSDTKLFLGAGHNGYIYFWNDRLQLEQNCGGFLFGHKGLIKKIVLSSRQDIFVSVGGSDQMVIEWKVLDMESEEIYKDDELELFQHLIGFQTQLIRENLPNLQQKYVFDRNKKQLNGIGHESLLRELLYCCMEKQASLQELLKDSSSTCQLSNQKLFQKNLQHQFQTVQEAQFKLIQQRPPPLNIELEFVYGFCSFDRRRSLMYAHIYQHAQQRGRQQKMKQLPENANNSALLNQPNTIMIPNFYQKEMIYAQQQLPEYDCVHVDCQRFLVYYTSRLVVLLNPLTNKQRIYQGHTGTVCCLAVHPTKYWIASTELDVEPQIQVWNVYQLEPFRNLKTLHKNSIINLIFSNEDALIVSISVDISFSIQISDWKSEEILAFRNSSSLQVFDIQFNPLKKNQFVTCGLMNITFWEFKGKNLLRMNQLLVKNEKHQDGIISVTCLGFINYSLGDTLDNDIIAGDCMGNLILVSCGKHIVAKEMAHSKEINCLKITELFKDKIIIITAGEDEYIRIWDTKFLLVNQIYLRQTGFYNDFKLSRQISPQSVDVFICSRKNSEGQAGESQGSPEGAYPILLIGTRSGDILEASFNLEFTGLQKYSNLNSPEKITEDKAEEQGSSQSSDNGNNTSDDEMSQADKGDSDAKTSSKQLDKIQFSYYMILKSLNSQIFSGGSKHKKLAFDCHPMMSLIAACSQDQALCIYDTSSDKMIFMMVLSSQPTDCKFARNGNILIVGFQSGLVTIFEFDTGMPKKHQKTGGKHSTLLGTPKISVQQEIKDKGNKSPVISLQVSQNQVWLAVSYDQVRLTLKEQEKELSVVHLYRCPSNQIIFEKTHEIGCPSALELNKPNNQNVAVYFMQFSHDSKAILMYYQEFEKSSQRLNNDNLGTFLAYDLDTKEVIKQMNLIKNWGGLQFPNILQANFSVSQGLILSQDNQDQSEPIKSITNPMSAMLIFKHFLILGSNSGEIHIANQFCLNSQEKESAESQVTKQALTKTKNYSAHSSSVNTISLDWSGQYLFTSGLEDETIFKWRFVEEKPFWSGENYLSEKNDAIQADVYEEIISEKELHQLRKLHQSRLDIPDVILNVDNSRENKIGLELKSILGRRSHDRHSNLFYDYDEKILYIAGTNLVIQTNGDSEVNSRERGRVNQEISVKTITSLAKQEISGIKGAENGMLRQDTKGGGLSQSDKKDLNPEATLFQNQENSSLKDNPEASDLKNEASFGFKQQFIKLDTSENSVFPEISCISLSKDKKLLCAGTSQQNAQLILWDICSLQFLDSIRLTNTSLILNIRFAYDNRNVLVQAMSDSYSLELFLIDFWTKKILAMVELDKSHVFLIKDLDFYPTSQNSFVTCGVQHLASWTQKGSLLNFANMQIETPKDTLQTSAEGDGATILFIENQKVLQKKLVFPEISFLCLVFVRQTLITAADDGFLYVWKDMKIAKRQNAHPKTPILCLSTTQNSNIFVSGGMDGKVIIWELGSSNYNFILEKFYEYHIGEDEQTLKQQIKGPEQFIQSVCIGSQYILAGTKSGDIYELIRPDETELKSTTKATTDLVKIRFNAFDHEVPISLQVSGNSQILYSLSQNGLLSVWQLRNLKRIFRKLYNLASHSLLVCQQFQIVILAFCNHVRFLEVNHEINKYDELKDMQLHFNSNISDIKINLKEDLIAVALDPNQEQNAKIDIYSVNFDLKEPLKIYSVIDNLSTRIDFLDFSSDSYYLIYKDNFEDVAIINLSEKIKQAHIDEYEIEWNADGLKVAKQTKGIHPYYNDTNKILKVFRISKDTILVTSEMGIIRLFNYPCYAGPGNSYFRFYADHLNEVTQSVDTPDKKLIITCSQVDRCIFIWKVNNGLEK